MTSQPNPTHMIPTAVKLANDLQLMQSHYLSAQVANRGFDIVAGRIRRQLGMQLRLEQLLALSRISHVSRHFAYA